MQFPRLSLMLVAIAGVVAGCERGSERAFTGSRPPHIDGYRLLQRWTDIGRTLPCGAVVDSGSAAALARFPDQQCQASDSVTLWFARDTLIGVFLDFGEVGQTANVQHSWRTRAAAFTRFFGASPDSVTLADSGEASGTGARILTAHWEPRADRYWGATVLIGEVELSAGQAVVGNATLMLACAPGEDCSDSARMSRFRERVRRLQQ